ncbi:hypothetical protein L1887_18368 [Cichorium endivia]|nr:hypothetical protein L1887_18368 [Cichorium endivia]
MLSLYVEDDSKAYQSFKEVMTRLISGGLESKLLLLLRLYCRPLILKPWMWMYFHCGPKRCLQKTIWF